MKWGGRVVLVGGGWAVVGRGGGGGSCLGCKEVRDLSLPLVLEMSMHGWTAVLFRACAKMSHCTAVVVMESMLMLQWEPP